MNALPELQHRFMDFLLTGNAAPFLQDIAVRGNLPAEVRAGIYGNAYKLRFRETLETDHEMLGLYLGDALFDAMVEGYVASRPSGYFSLRDYTSHLPDFLAANPPFSNHPILAEIARFERLLLDVFDAADTPCATLDDLRAMPPEQWPGMQLRFHPGMQFFSAAWNSVESWRALKAGETPDPATAQPGSQWLLWRGSDRLSQFRSMPDEERELLLAALHGADFAALCEILGAYRGVEEAPAAMLGYLANWLDNGMVSNLA